MGVGLNAKSGGSKNRHVITSLIAESGHMDARHAPHSPFKPQPRRHIPDRQIVLRHRGFVLKVGGDTIGKRGRCPQSQHIIIHTGRIGFKTELRVRVDKEIPFHFIGIALKLMKPRDIEVGHQHPPRITKGIAQLRTHKYRKGAPIIQQRMVFVGCVRKFL